MATKTQVLVVGGGLNGLTAALLLAHQGVRCILVERHPGTSIQYKFAGISPRSMEIFRGLGACLHALPVRSDGERAAALS